MTLNPLVYVCVMSSFNLPEWEACLLRRPSDVVLVVSSFKQAQEGAEHMAELLEQQLPGVVVHRPESRTMPLAGDDALSAQAWLNQVLLPYLARPALAEKPRWLNMTGGTKSMQLALLTTVRWEQLDYTPANSGQVRAIGLEKAPLAPLEERGSETLTTASAKDVARLYNNSVTFGVPNPLLYRPASCELAERIFRGLTDEDPGLDAMFAALRRLWIDGSGQEQWKQKELALTWPEFLEGETFPDPALMVWLQSVEMLAPECWSISESGICLPGNKVKNKSSGMHGALKEWLTSGWWEQLAHVWLLGAGLPEAAVASNVHGGEQQENSSTKREADLLVHFRSRTTVVEVKVEPAPGQAPKEMENQVSGLADRFGRTQKALLVSPLVRRRLKARQWEDFAARCRANNVALCEDRATLLQAVGAAPAVATTPHKTPHKEVRA
ncbi:hypothetical protein [Halomonas sp.]|uniref:hypothetical protein n=1 Tax=Halomonas sp. TaxID=1486246 RepID=UPI00384D5347